MVGVEKRLDSDARVGFLLSGGLDSSLVCSIAQKKSDKPIKTFAIGMNTDAIDLKYAKQVADYIGSGTCYAKLYTSRPIYASFSQGRSQTSFSAISIQTLRRLRKLFRRSPSSV